MGVFLFIKVPMKTSVILVVLALVALSVAQSCSIISGSYLCFNPATTSVPVNPRVSIDLEGNTRTFRVVYPNNECTYQGDADISSNGSTLTVSNVVCDDASACSNNINFSCTDFVVNSIGYSANCAEWEGTRNGAQLACNAQFNVGNNNNNNDSSATAVLASAFALFGVVAFI